MQHKLTVHTLNTKPERANHHQDTQRFLRSLREFLLSQLALLEPPLVWLNLCPLPRPRDDLPAAVRPLSSLCFWTGLHIQLILGSLVMAAWCTSTMMTSKYL